MNRRGAVVAVMAAVTSVMAETYKVKGMELVTPTIGDLYENSTVLKVEVKGLPNGKCRITHLDFGDSDCTFAVSYKGKTVEISAEEVMAALEKPDNSVPAEVQRKLMNEIEKTR